MLLKLQGTHFQPEKPLFTKTTETESSNTTVHSECNNTERTNSTSTHGSSTMPSATNKEKVNEKATPTEAMVIQAAPVLDDSGTSASEGAPDSTLKDMPHKHYNSGS